MRFNTGFLLLVLSAGLLEGVVAQRGQGGQGGQNQGQAQGQGQGQNQGQNQGQAAAASSSAVAAAAASSSAAAAAAATAAATDQTDNNNQGATQTQTGNNGNNNNGNNNADDDVQSSLTLSQDAIQTASASVGNVNATAGEAESQTSENNFINFCVGKTLTNGQQLEGGSCNGIPMGDIPSTANMISTIITNPQNGETINANEDFTFSAQTSNLQAGTFTNAATTYYNVPQTLNGGGQIIGHLHFTAQKLDEANPAQPPNAQEFAFFKGVNDDGNGQGLLSAAVDGGLPDGTYRVCTMTSAANHQPVIMPVAQRGAQDDCTKFTVGNANNANNNGNANTNANANANTDNAAAAQQQANNGQGGGRGRQRGRFTKRDFIA